MASKSGDDARTRGLDRIRTKLREIEHQTDRADVNEGLERARDEILSSLETLDDRGMKQH